MSNLRKNRNSPFRARAVAVMLALTPAAVILGLTVLFASLKIEEPPKASLADCQAIREAADRLACYDMLAKERLPMPAKGGQAILSD